MPQLERISAAMEQKVSPRNRGSRPTITRAPCDFCELTYRAIPVTARRTFSKVNSSAITARHPDVPNLICVGMISRTFCCADPDRLDRMDSMQKSQNRQPETND